MSIRDIYEDGRGTWFSGCAASLGRADFLKWFDAPDSRALAQRLRTDYEVNGQTAWTLMNKAERFRIELISALPSDQTRLMSLISSESLEAFTRLGSGMTGYVMPMGAKELPVVAPQRH